MSGFHPSVKQIFRHVFEESKLALRVFIIKTDEQVRQEALILDELKSIRAELKKTNLFLNEMSDYEHDEEN